MRSNSAVVNSIIARCVLDSAFLEQFARDPAAALGGYTIDERARSEFLRLDVNRVRNFVGLMTKVKHNFLWESFPYTRVLLRHYKIEIEVFAAYASIHQRIRAEGRSSEKLKIESFLSFLQGYLDPETDFRCIGLREMLTHERIGWEIRTSLRRIECPVLSKVDSVSCLRSSGYDTLVPVVRGLLRVGEFSRGPFAIMSFVGAGNLGLHRIPVRRRYFAYWGDTSTQELRVLELDKGAAGILQQVDGHRSIKSITSQVTRNMVAGVRKSEVRSFFQATFKYGLLTVRPRHPSETPPCGSCL